MCGMLLALLALAHGGAQRQLFRQYGQTEGLSNLNVRCIAQDHTGYLWVGTDNGLFRYDGGTFQIFGHAEGLANTEIIGLAEAPNGVIWAATQGGLARLSGKRFVTVDFGVPGEADGIVFDPAGVAYVKYPKGISRGVPGKDGSFAFKTIVSGDIQAITVLNGDLVFGLNGDVMHMAGGMPQSVGASVGLPSDHWEALSLDSLGNLWARSPTRLFELARGQARFVDRSIGVPHTNEGRLFSDRHGRVFVSSLLGLVIVEGNHVSLIDSAHGLPGDYVGPMLVDREESLWFGVDGAGLARRLGHGEWVSWTREDGLLNSSVWAIRTDALGQLWVGTSGGLTILDAQGKVMRSWTSHNGLAGDRVYSITPGPAGDFYVGTGPVGVSHFDGHGRLLRTYGEDSGITADQASSLLVDGEKRLWVMGNGGCFRSRTALGAGRTLTFERVEIPGIPAPRSFRHVILDKAGDVWIASSGGLLRFDGKSWKVFGSEEGLKALDLAAVAMGRNAIWVSYRDAFGMSKLGLGPDAGKVTHYTMQDGLSSNEVYAMAFDLSGRLWLNTDAGVDVLEEGRWWRHYGSQKGLIWDDTNSRALDVSPRGDVWVGTSGGMSRFRRADYPIPEVAPPVVLTSVRGVAREWQTGDRPVLPYSQRSLYIRYAGLSFEAEREVRFRYRLNGYDQAWNETNERSVHFAALPAGHYVFQVVAVNPSGLQSATPASFEFTIRPAWWQSWWFVASCLLLAGFLGYVFWHLRVRAFLAQKELLERQVAERTAQLRESHRQLEEIAYFDILTSLPNRRMFTEEFRKRLAMARRPSEPFALLLIDLDHFKQINDTYGHNAGDAVLVETSCLLRGIVRESDCVARLGGDEFAVLLFTAQDPETVESVCHRILDSFAGGIPFENTTLSVGCSIGIAMYPEHGETQESLYKSADVALYEAKRTGRNLFCWHRYQTGD
ncbi:diguanylate cyclase/phosphodiesterase (GGDEF & EAL domains) with PAS/PAC sensor(s) [Granulicella sibirica]|uniref:Diguanylate cyclase/phosphodiesterase (GGDEF & EAL domains) with PAS/PAC sensor(S) n=2 Tax=Granulicella sibirica TaxID=2479048 RepID=A0A4Q0SUV1_9BACT|nr:diguanylate cyclase/phosphodiesterase (GGDEF & EAL domains) with PAS/PAC sensor(s) [Granulicella sibirica]